MTLKALEKDINLDFSLVENFDEDNKHLKLRIQELSIVNGAHNAYQEIHLDSNYVGSKLFMGSENDIMCFSLNTRKINALEIKVPYDIKIEESDFKIPQIEQIHELKLLDDDHFTLEEHKYATYFKNDFLLLFYPEKINFKTANSLKLNNDLFVFIENDTIVGWGLNNCTNLMFDQWYKRFDKKNSMTSSILKRYFLLRNEDLFNKINEEDLQTKKMMLELIEDAKNAECYTIAEALEEYLDY